MDQPATCYVVVVARRRRHASLIPLSHDHRTALGLAFRLHHPAPPGPVTAMTPASTPASRAAETLAFYDDHLLAHFRAEEEVLFPFLRTTMDGAAATLMDALTADHRRFAVLCDAVAKADDDAARDVALTAFADLLEQHVRREERELFERFPDHVATADAEAMATRLLALLGRAAPER